MELVTLAHVTLNRVGSASRYAFSGFREVRKVGEVKDERAETLREFVLQIAEENGEARESLRDLTQVNAWTHHHEPDAVVFNVQGPNIQYSTPYAICRVHPALKSGQRYFRLEEVNL